MVAWTRSSWRHLGRLVVFTGLSLALTGSNPFAQNNYLIAQSGTGRAPELWKTSHNPCHMFGTSFAYNKDRYVSFDLEPKQGAAIPDRCPRVILVGKKL